MTELNPNSPETKVPALPTPQSPQQLLQALKELIEVREGQRGNPLDQNVTWRELVKSGVAQVVINGQPVGGSDPTFPLQPPDSGDPALDLSPPPQPTGLTASSAIQTVILGWSDPGLPNIALTEVWRSSTNVAPDVVGSVAVLIGTTESFLYADDVGLSSATRYYWVRFRSKADVDGPYSSGVTGSTGLVGGVDLSDLIITAQKLAADAVEEGKIKDAAVTTTKIANLAVGNAAIQNGAITNAKIGSLAVDSAKIADAAIVEAKIADASITNGKIANAAITDAKIAAATITSASIANATITGAKIAAATITAANIQNATITSAQIAAATITGANIASATIGGANIASATITGANIASATIGGANIASATITGANIASATITDANIANLNASKITAGTLDAARIGAGSITGTMIAGETVLASNIAAGTITGSRIAAGTITASNIQASTITASQIAAGTITAAQISAGSITADRLQANTITAASGVIANAAITNAMIASIDAGKITAGTIDAARISAGSITTDKLQGKKITAGNGVGGLVQLGEDVVASGHYGLSLSDSNYDNIFIRRSDGIVYFRVGGGNANYIDFSSTGGLLIKGSLTADAINAVNTLNVTGESITVVRNGQWGYGGTSINANSNTNNQRDTGEVQLSAPNGYQRMVVLTQIVAANQGGATNVGCRTYVRSASTGWGRSPIGELSFSTPAGFVSGHTFVQQAGSGFGSGTIYVGGEIFNDYWAGGPWEPYTVTIIVLLTLR